MLADDEITAYTIEKRAREIAREELASMCGLVLKRAGEPAGPTRLESRNVANDVVREVLAEIFGEALHDFGGTASEPGPAAA